jgi:hypothetical protein
VSDSPHFTVAVVGAPDADPEWLAGRLDLLLTRGYAGVRIALVSAGRRSPPLGWCQRRGWSLYLATEPADIVALADAAVVVGDPRPWRRLIRLFEAAGKPHRVVAVPAR